MCVKNDFFFFIEFELIWNENACWNMKRINSSDWFIDQTMKCIFTILY